MKSYVTLALAIVLLATLSGCSAPSSLKPKSAASTQPFADSSTAIVYVFRIANGQWEGRVAISVDGTKIADVGDSEYSWCRMAPGDHLFRVEWGLIDKPLFEGGHFDAKTLKLRIEPNKVYYLCYSIRENDKPTTTVESSGLLGKALSKSHVVAVDFQSEEESLGLHDIGTCVYRKNRLNK